MKRVMLLVVPLVSGCAVEMRPAAPEPVVAANAQPAPPPPPGEAPPPSAPAPAADGTGDPVQTGEPEEVTATSEPPDPVYEEPTDAPGPAYVWVGGYWGWGGVGWGWNWGRWEVAPEGRVYIEPYYERVDDHVVYVHGYWGGRDAPHRSYGGERIRFAAAPRPANYRRGEHTIIEPRPGIPPGRRPGGAYEHATGTLRPVPRESVPRRAPVQRTAAVVPAAEPRVPPTAEVARSREAVAVQHTPVAANGAGVPAATPAACRGAAKGPAPNVRPSGEVCAARRATAPVVAAPAQEKVVEARPPLFRVPLLGICVIFLVVPISRPGSSLATRRCQYARRVLLLAAAAFSVVRPAAAAGVSRGGVHRCERESSIDAQTRQAPRRARKATCVR